MPLKKLATVLVVLGAIAALVAYGLGWVGASPSVSSMGPPPPTLPKPMAPSLPDAANNSVDKNSPTRAPDPSTVAAPARTAASGPTVASPALPEWVRNPPDLGLSRTLTGEQDVFYDGRHRKVLGTKTSKAEGNFGQPVLLVRDETSGQVEYYQSGLQFRLTPGLDYASFLRERPRLQPQFVNSDYAAVIVDAGSIADEYRKLKADPRVAFVGFLVPKPVQKLK